MHNDRMTVWAIIGSIMFGFFAALVITTGFAWAGRPVPEPIGHLLDASFGALSTLLAQTRSEAREARDREQGQEVHNGTA